MADKIENNGTLFVEFPTYRYTQDVKELARKAGLKIVDIRFQGDMAQAEKAPKLTLKKEYLPKKEETPIVAPNATL